MLQLGLNHAELRSSVAQDTPELYVMLNDVDHAELISSVAQEKFELCMSLLH